MSLDLNPLVEFISTVAPTTFVIAVAAGIIGNVAYGWFSRRLMSRHYFYLDDIEKLVGEIKKDGETKLSEKDIERLKIYIELLSLDEKLIEKKFGTDLVASRIARLGEYLSNHSPADSLSRGIGK